MNFDSFNLDPKLLSNIKTLGYLNPTPIQAKSIPPILEEKDIMGLAQTGTGKTAAFLLPILQQLLNTTPATKAVRALVIAPTRELAQQIDDSVKSLARGTGLRSVALYGGIKIGGQISALRQGVDIAVACPGRLLDHLQQRTVQLSQVKILVLDEADQMFDMGFLPNIRRILKQLPKKRQTLLFSATMPSAVDVLAQEILHQPVTISIARSSTPSSVQQTIFPVTAHQKSELLIHLLHRTEMESVLIFTRTKHTAKNLSLTLEQAGFRTASLQGNLSQNKRQAVMNNFRSGKLKILVATDIASRGIDVMSISHVINYDMPGTVEAYIHRIGRTGRAAKSGDAYTFASDQDQHEIRRIEKVLGFKLKQHRFEDFDYKAASTKPKRSSSNRRSEYKAHPRRQDRDQDERKGRGDRSEYSARPRRQDRDQDQDTRREPRGRSQYSDQPRRQDRDQDERKGRRDRSEYSARPRRQDRDQDQDTRREPRGRSEYTARPRRQDRDQDQDARKGRGDNRSEYPSRSRRQDQDQDTRREPRGGRSQYSDQPRRQDRDQDQDARKGRRGRSEYTARPRRQDRDQDQDTRREPRGRSEYPAHAKRQDRDQDARKGQGRRGRPQYPEAQSKRQNRDSRKSSWA